MNSSDDEQRGADGGPGDRPVEQPHAKRILHDGPHSHPCPLDRARLRSDNRPVKLASAILLLGLSAPGAPLAAASQDVDLAAPRVLENLKTRKYSGRPMDLLVSDVPLTEVFTRLGDAAGLRFDLDPRLRETVTYRIRRTPWDEVLALVLADHDLSVDPLPDGRGFKVYRGTKSVVVFTDSTRLALVLFLYRYLIPIGVGIVLIAGVFAAYRWRRRQRSGVAPPARKPLLAPEAADATRQRLVRLLEVDKAYLKDGLSLRELAEELSVTPHQLSWLINDVLGQSFSSLVNGYRVEEAKKRLAGPATDAANMLEIGIDSGFGTKAAFNRAFRKHTGMTPSEYWRTHNR